MELSLTAPVELQAAAEGRPPRVSILAYGGGEMTPSGWGPVVIDLARLELAASIPLLADHDSTMNGVAGSGTPRVENHKLYVSGTLAPTPAGVRARELAAAGVPLEASVGVNPTDTHFARPGESVRANGREHKAGPRGLTLVRAGRLREVSITPLGADSTTTVSIAARRDAMSATTADQTTADPQAAATAERERIKAIRDVCAGRHPELEARAIDSGWDVPTLKANLFDAVNQGAKAEAFNAYMSAAPASPGPRGGGPAARPRDVIAAAALLMARQDEVAAKHFGERLVGGIARPSGWPELAAAALRAEGRDVPSDRNELLRAAFSTTSMPVALGTAVQKTALEVFLELSSTWMSIGRMVDAADFKAGKAVRLSAVSGFEKVGPAGEIKHGDLAEDAFTYRVETYARMFGLTRQDIINDDASLLSDLPTVLGSEGARSVSDLFFSVLVGNAGNHFHANNNNLLTTGSALAVGSLGAAIKALRTQKDRDGRIIGFQPVTLLVPAALEQTARALLNSSTLQRDQSEDEQPTASPFANLNLNLAVEPRLDATSEANWYLFSAPRHAALLVAFLRGARSPVVEQVAPPSNVLGVQWRAYMDFGVSLGEPKAGVKATGAA